jgi:hypothetical protein
MLQDRVITNVHSDSGQIVPLEQIQRDPKLKPLITYGERRPPLASLVEETFA